MPQYTQIMQVNLPEGYVYRYSLDYLIKLHSTNQGMGIMDVIADAISLLEAANVGMKERMFYNYRTEDLESTKELMSEERMEVLAEYFGVEIEQLLTENIIPRK